MKKSISYLLCIILILSCNALSFSDQKKENAVVLSFRGTVKIFQPGKDAPEKCRRDLALYEGTKIVTGRNAFVDLAFDKKGENKVRVSENSNVVILFKGREKIELVDGEAFFLIKRLKGKSAFEVTYGDKRQG